MAGECKCRIEGRFVWGVKGYNEIERFERKINAGFTFSVSALVEKHSSSNFLTHFQHEKKLQFRSKKVNFKYSGNFHINTKQQFITILTYLIHVSIWNRRKLAPSFRDLVLRSRGSSTVPSNLNKNLGTWCRCLFRINRSPEYDNNVRFILSP